MRRKEKWIIKRKYKLLHYTPAGCRNKKRFRSKLKGGRYHETLNNKLNIDYLSLTTLSGHSRSILSRDHPIKNAIIKLDYHTQWNVDYPI